MLLHNLGAANKLAGIPGLQITRGPDTSSNVSVISKVVNLTEFLAIPLENIGPGKSALNLLTKKIKKTIVLQYKFVAYLNIHSQDLQAW